MEFLDRIYEIKSRKGILAVLAVVLAVFLLIFMIGSENSGELTEAEALERVPFLALTEEELALADTILEHEDFRNALNHDLVENSTLFTPEETKDVIGSVIPAGAEVAEIAVSGAVVIIDYRQPQYRVVLEYVDADRSGKIDSIRKSLTPMIDGISTGCYQVNHNRATGKTVYTYTSF